jgi:DNA invertase Pin-like site-specific DNA recombinase
MKKIRCAIYTRKSSEEGLDQSFNSLDAQREACEAYILSQKSEGWSANREAYDDGGWSGGSMERPGLKRLLADIEAGRIDIVVVYKVDRLTRSLADFARMVDLFDRHGVSFVSVTQAFNTTTSMGRLTLNVLLSFAQFEREVTGERIRDKIAASKARGMWMGGNPPLGYDPQGRTLVVNEAEAATVRHIFARYLELGSVHAVTAELAADSITSKLWTSSNGNIRGGAPFTRGALFHLLRNRIYLGEIVHKGRSHPGQHSAIIDAATFEAVQLKLNENAVVRGERVTRRAPLTGLLFDSEGNRMSPTHSRNRHGKRYLYYASAPLQMGGGTRDDTLRRVPAAALEEALVERLRCWSRRSAAPLVDLLTFVKKVAVHNEAIIVEVAPPPHEEWGSTVEPQEHVCDAREGLLQIRSPIRLCTRGGRTWLLEPNGSRRSRPSRPLIAALRRAHAELQLRGIDMTEKRGQLTEPRGVDDPYLRKLTGLVFLAPDIQRAILEGRQPTGLTLSSLLSVPLPLDWQEQRRQLGFAS